jgi:hypothetical protein
MPRAKILRMSKPDERENSDSAFHLPPVTIVHLPLCAAEETASAEKIQRWLKLADAVLHQGELKRA